MRAIDVMTKDVVTATPEMTVQDVAKLMINHRISGIPIVEGDRQLVGIVTEGDLLRRSETGTERQHSHWSEWFSPNSRLAAAYIKSHARRLADIMTRDVVNVSELATLGEIADLMEARRIKRVPVVHDGKLVGIVSRADLLRILASGGANLPDDDRDRPIRSRLLAELRKQKWANPNESDIIVSDGVVWLASDWAKVPVGVICFVLAAVITLPIPLGHLAPGTAICLLALGLMERDGIVIGVGFAVAVLAFVIVTLASAGVADAVHHWVIGLTFAINHGSARGVPAPLGGRIG